MHGYRVRGVNLAQHVNEPVFNEALVRGDVREVLSVEPAPIVAGYIIDKPPFKAACDFNDALLLAAV